MSITKTVVIGSVNGCFELLSNKLHKMAAQASLSYGFCCGDFFGDDSESVDQLLANQFKFPFPIYIISGEKQIPERISRLLDSKNVELCENLCFLGRSGTWTAPDGLSVAFLGGVFRPKVYEANESDLNTFYLYQVEELLNSAKPPVDVLLTYDPPRFMHDQIEGSPVIDRLALNLSPRYHFSSSIFVDRAPYAAIDENAAPTRFLGLASIMSSERWFYAFNLIPYVHNSLQGIETIRTNMKNITENPFINLTRKRAISSETIEPRKKQKIEKCKNTLTQDCQQKFECWFCLDSPTIANHLIYAIRNQNYAAIARGPLVPFHSIITPKQHAQTYGKAGKDSRTERKQIEQEIAAFYLTKGQETVVFEISRAVPRIHAHVQCVPLVPEIAQLIPASFETTMKQHGLEYKEYSVKTLAALSDEEKANSGPNRRGGFFFEFRINDRIYFHEINRNSRTFPLQIGREVISHALGDLERGKDWKLCIDDDLETQYANEMKMFLAKE